MPLFLQRAGKAARAFAAAQPHKIWAAQAAAAGFLLGAAVVLDAAPFFAALAALALAGGLWACKATWPAPPPAA